MLEVVPYGLDEKGVLSIHVFQFELAAPDEHVVRRIRHLEIFYVQNEGKTGKTRETGEKLMLTPGER